MDLCAFTPKTRCLRGLTLVTVFVAGFDVSCAGSEPTSSNGTAGNTAASGGSSTSINGETTGGSSAANAVTGSQNSGGNQGSETGGAVNGMGGISTGGAATGGGATGGAMSATGGSAVGTGGATGSRTTGGASSTGGSATGGTSSSGTCSPICTSTTQKTKGTFCDSRDNRTYSCVPIGTQTWMAENLNFGSQVSGGVEQTNGQKYCYKNLTSNCDDATYHYGGLYQWANAMGLDTTCNGSSCTLSTPVQGICPPGWHIPTSSEFSTVKTYGDANNGDLTMAMTFKATTNWASNPSTGVGGPGEDTFGFTAYGAGGRWLVGASCTSSGTALTADNNFCWGLKFRGMWWEASQSDATTGTIHDISDDQDGFTRMGSQNKAMGFSLRCVQN